MAKIQDRLYNRNIVGKLLELSDEEKINLGIATPQSVETAINSDKEVLSKCLWVDDAVTDNTTLYFPKYVLPISLYVDDLGKTLFFDYTNDSVIAEGGDTYGMDCIDNQVHILFNKKVVATEGEDAISFAYFNKYTPALSFVPKESGTKLYKHTLVVTDGDNVQHSFVLVNNNGKAITYIQDVKGFVLTGLSADMVVCGLAHDENEGDHYFLYTPTDDAQELGVYRRLMTNVVSDTVAPY